MAANGNDLAQFFASSQSGGAAGLLGTNGKGADELDEGLSRLPSYTRSLLRIKVPVVVTLASSRLSVKRILELGQGAILPFEKSCEEQLTLSVGNQDVAVGEAVKVGDKFGLRISSMVMPQEKFWALRGKSSGEQS